MKDFPLIVFNNISSPDVALPSVSAYDNENQMLTFVKSQLKEIAERKGIIDHTLVHGYPTGRYGGLVL